MKTLYWPKAVLFDLDGTLLDSAPDIAAATNELLSINSLPLLHVDDVRMMIGNGVRKLVERAFIHHGKHLGEADLNAHVATMMTIFGNHITNHTKPYDGADALIRSLNSDGVKLAIVTNKPERFVGPIIAHFGWSELFDVVLGGDTLATKKPEPEMLLSACDALGVNPNDAIMVGDNAADIDAAKNAGLVSIAMRGGYTRTPVDQLGATHVADGFGALKILLSTIK